MEDKRTYLTMIQGAISRFSTASAIIKGFAATIFTGIIALFHYDIGLTSILSICIPLISFASLDIYYLRVERLYRALYNNVLMDKHKVDYSMDLSRSKKDIKEAKATVIDCFMSPSILLFYPSLFIIIALLLFT